MGNQKAQVEEGERIYNGQEKGQKVEQWCSGCFLMLHKNVMSFISFSFLNKSNKHLLIIAYFTHISCNILLIFV